jgi:hypothetical protein
MVPIFRFSELIIPHHLERGMGKRCVSENPWIMGKIIIYSAFWAEVISMLMKPLL